MSGAPGWAGRQGSDDTQVHCWARANQVEASQCCVLMKTVPFPRGRRSCTCCTWGGGGRPGPPGPSRCPAPLLTLSVACSEPCDLCSPYDPRLRGTCPCVASVCDCLSSPGHPPQAQGASPEPRRQAEEPGCHSWGWGFRGCESGVLWHQPCEPGGPSPSPPSPFIQTSLGTSLPVFSTSVQGARIISLG